MGVGNQKRQLLKTLGGGGHSNIKVAEVNQSDEGTVRPPIIYITFSVDQGNIPYSHDYTGCWPRPLVKIFK